MRVLIAGGAGFIGSHLCGFYCRQGAEVICLDNFITGRQKNIRHLRNQKKFTFQKVDVTKTLPKFKGKVDRVYHLASPASPVDYQRFPLETLKVGSVGTENLLRLALEKEAVFVLASTSEIYGEPLVHPQREDYWGNVNSVGPRSVYDESKRFAEAITTAYCRKEGLKAGIARIFNTYGPRLRLDDGRVVPNFICQAIKNEPVTVYGKGTQTRSLCYVSDLVRGLVRLAENAQKSKESYSVVNLGNPEEITVLNLAKKVVSLCDSRSKIVFKPLPEDDPTRRCPDISRAKKLLGWEPEIGMEEGLKITIAWFRKQNYH
ncbi:MAG: UDP-glucuronic acid decarboxylase family protein [Candidatus Omnitrophota bacterium]